MVLYDNRNKAYRTRLVNCEHYPRSKTLSIFDCCLKVYNCYKCHDNNEKHNYIPANKGFCMRCTMFFEERKDKCSTCEANFLDYA